jgi:hypothetical protein
MKKNVFWGVALLALMTACSGGGGGKGGTFTLTNIPLEFEGKYAWLMTSEDDDIGGAKSFNFSTGTITSVRIADGKVSIPMWKFIGEDEGNLKTERYAGNHTLGVKVSIGNAESSSGGFMPAIAEREFAKVDFVDGSASKNWNEQRIWTH